MKKTLIAVAALAATGAFAQVSVYGRLDVGYSNVTHTNGTTETKQNGVDSHNSVSSYWGVKGSEDLGGGLKAVFNLEQDVYPANGALGVSGSQNGNSTAAGFNRQSNVGLSGGFGTVSLGRNSAPAFGLTASTGLIGVARYDTAGMHGAGSGSSIDKSIAYTSPNMSGFTLNVLYQNTDDSTTTNDAKTGETQLVGTYANGPLMVGASSRSKSKVNAATGTTADKDEGTALAASYDLGVVKIAGNIQNRKQTPGAGNQIEDKEVNLYAAFPMGKATLLAAYGTNKKTNTNAAGTTTGDATGSDMSLGVDYALSAKTAVFFRTGTVNKFDKNGDIADQKTSGSAVGVRTSF